MRLISFLAPVLALLGLSGTVAACTQDSECTRLCRTGYTCELGYCNAGACEIVSIDPMTLVTLHSSRLVSQTVRHGRIFAERWQCDGRKAFALIERGNLKEFFVLV